MKKIIIIAIALVMGLGVEAAKKKEAKSVAPKVMTLADSVGQTIGLTQGEGFRRQLENRMAASTQDAYKAEFMRGLREAVLADTARTGYRDGLRAGGAMTDEFIKMRGTGIPVNFELFVESFGKTYLGDKLTEEEYAAQMDLLRKQLEPLQRAYEQQQQRAIEEQQQAREAQARANSEAGKKFLDRLKANDPDVKTTESGLVYKVITPGEGPTLQPTQKAKVRYTGRFIDGNEFDSSGDRTVSFSPSQVIKGFGEGLMLMNKGAHYQLYIPDNLAYGTDAPPVIGPNQTLVFDVEVVDFE